MVFDKTGTLTEGRFGVARIWTLGERSEDEVLALAATLERRSEHPVAQAIVAAGEERGLVFLELDRFASLPGKGVEATVGGREIKVVSPGYLREAGIEPPAASTGAGPMTLVYVLEDERVIGALGLADRVRAESREAVAELRDLGVEAIMLTGDNQAVAEWVAAELGLRRVPCRCIAAGQGSPDTRPAGPGIHRGHGR